VFPAIGLLAIWFPQLLGNGKGLAQAGFDGDLGLALAAALFLLKLLVTFDALRAGAAGGLLTPGLALGGLLGCVVGGLWNHVWPSVPFGAFAIVGSAAFLASSMKMPLTAIVLILEFTRVGHDFLFPISLAVAGSISVFHLCTERNVRCNLGRNKQSPFSSCCMGRWLPLVSKRQRFRSGHGRGSPICRRGSRRDISQRSFPIH
jgi:H+/Cl- antiporter ClcA